MSEKTLIIVKPDAVKRGLVGRILSRFEDRNFKIIDLRLLQFSRQQASLLYSPHTEKTFFKDLVDFIISGPVVAAILQGNGAIAVTRAMIGATDSSKANPGTVRGDFGLGVTENIIHASDSQESFERESKIIFS